MQGNGNQPLEYTYAETLLLIHKESDVTESNKINYSFNWFIYSFITYLFNNAVSSSHYTV